MGSCMSSSNLKTSPDMRFGVDPMNRVRTIQYHDHGHNMIDKKIPRHRNRLSFLEHTSDEESIDNLPWGGEDAII